MGSGVSVSLYKMRMVTKYEAFGICWVSMLTTRCARVLFLVVCVYACVTAHRFRKAKRRSRVGRLGFEIAKTLVEKEQSSQEYRYT